jgi:hypothetical protein
MEKSRGPTLDPDKNSLKAQLMRGVPRDGRARYICCFSGAAGPGGSFLIVDTGPWIFGKKVMLPAGVVERIDPESEAVFVNLTKDEIKSAPEYDQQTGREDTNYRRRLGEHYQRH